MRRIWIPIIGALVGVLALAVVAQEEGEKPAGGAMPEWMKRTEEHAGLERLAGEWDVSAKFFPGPDAAPQTHRFTASGKVVFDGYFVEQDVTAPDFMGRPMHGRLVVGFDTIAKEYVTTWMDNWGPYLWVSRGTEKDGAIHFKGRSPDMMTGEMKDSWARLEWVDDDEYFWRNYCPGPDGKRYLHGELHYKRRP